MKKTSPALVLFAVASLFIGASLAAGGCASAKPDASAPQIRGAVTSVSAGGGVTSMLVVWDKSLGAQLDFDSASVSVPKSADVFRRNADGSFDRIEAKDIHVRDVVEVQLTGAVRESYPVQGDAEQVVVIGEWPTSSPLPTPPGLTPQQ